MAKSKSNEATTLIETSLDYRNKMAAEKYRRIKLQNDHQAFDLEKKRETICYKAVALSEFEKAIGSVYAQIKNAEEQLTSLLKLNTTQVDLLHDYMESILVDLSNIDIELSTTSDFDSLHRFDGTARKSRILKGETV